MELVFGCSNFTPVIWARVRMKIITTHAIAKEKQSNYQELVDNIVAMLYSFSEK